jgi:hypothetical protein
MAEKENHNRPLEHARHCYGRFSKLWEKGKVGVKCSCGEKFYRTYEEIADSYYREAKKGLVCHLDWYDATLYPGEKIRFERRRALIYDRLRPVTLEDKIMKKICE